jgi:hypothetical protein
MPAEQERSGTRLAVETAGADIAAEIAIVREQTRETLALLRQLVQMLLPDADPDRPKLEDLIAALVAQQGRILAVVGQLSQDLSAVLDLLAPVDGSVPGRPRPRNGGLRS